MSKHAKLPFERQCPSKYNCPFKRFSMKGMECTANDYPHLTVVCWIKCKNFLSDEGYGKLERKMKEEE